VPQLPTQFTRFFGREEEIARVAETLCIPETRLVTLTGPGGSGKTRLAIAVAGRLQEPSASRTLGTSTIGGRAGGPWFIPLAELTDARRIPEAVRDAMGLGAAPGGEPIEQIVAALQAAPSLLILDNFEQLVSEGAPLVRHLLERAPSLTCLVTSRQRLELEGEREFPVLPLPTPVDGQSLMADGPAKAELSDPSTIHHPPSTLMACPSVQLFVDRARAARPSFQLTPANAGAVAALCSRLEGLPLAIELAAARASVLTPQQMLARLEKRFELLVSPRRDVSTRHRTLRAAIESSYQLLPPELQRFFARLSVFRGGWTLAAAEAVCSDGEMPPLAFRWGGDLLLSPARELQCPEVLEHLEQLRQSSLVLVEDAGEAMRYRMLESLREFATEQLTPEETTALARRHFRYFLPVADVKRFYPEGAWMTEEQQKEWLRDLDAEYDNLRAALEWGLESEPGPALWLAAALGAYWSIRGSWGEAIAFLPRAASYALKGDEWLEMAAKALLYAGDLAHEVGENERGRAWSEEAAALGRKMGSPEILVVARRFERRDERLETDEDRNRRMGAAEYEAAALHNLGQLALDQGDYDRARSLFQESFEIRGRLWSGAGRSGPLAGLGWVAQAQGEHETARACYEESLALYRQTDNGRHVAQRLLDLGFLACHQRRYEAARRCFDEGLAILSGFGDRLKIGLSLKGLGDVALGCDQAAAAAHYRESLLLFRELGHRKSIVLALEGFARLAYSQEQWSRSASLLGTAQAVREAIAFSLPWNEQPEQQALRNALRLALGDTRFTAVWEEGFARPWQQAAALAMAE
jgi:predicted ATPase